MYTQQIQWPWKLKIGEKNTDSCKEGQCTVNSQFVINTGTAHACSAVQSLLTCSLSSKKTFHRQPQQQPCTLHNNRVSQFCGHPYCCESCINSAATSFRSNRYGCPEPVIGLLAGLDSSRMLNQHSQPAAPALQCNQLGSLPAKRYRLNAFGDFSGRTCLQDRDALWCLAACVQAYQALSMNLRRL